MRQVLPIAGAIVGAYFGNPQLGFAIGSLIGNAVDPLEIEGSKVGDNPMQTASEGGARAIVFGTGCVRATCLLERGNRQVVEEEDQAGKGGPVTVNERVYWTFAVGLGEAIPGGAIIRIWEGEKLVYDASPDSPIPAETTEFARKFRFYDGNEDQLPDPALEAIHGIGNAHYYRGTAYVVFPNYDLTDYREQVPVYRWEVAAAAEIDPVANTMALGRNSGSASTYTSTSATGEVFSNPQSGGAVWIKALSNGRFFGHASEESSWYTDDGGATKVLPVNAPPGTAGSQIGDYRNGVLIVPGGLIGGGVWVSSNEGESFTSVQWGEFTSQLVAINESSAVSLAPITNSKCRVASPFGTAWVEGAEHGLGIVTTAACCSTRHQSLFGGSDPGGSGKPKIVRTNSGLSFDGDVLFDSAGSAITAMHATSLVGGEYIWTAGTNAGEIYVNTSDNPVWEKLAISFQASDATFNGHYWMYSGADSEGAPSILLTSDFENFAFADHPFLNLVEYIDSHPQSISPTMGEKIPLSSILTRLHLRAGHSSADFDAIECTELVAGVVFESTVTFAEAINSVIGSYFKDPSEYDKQIHYLSRGKAVVRTLTEDDLVDEPETSRRENAIEYPRKLHYFFQSPITHYAATKATSSRSSPDVHVIGEASVTSPITYNDPDEPAQVSAKLHKVYWADAEGEIVWHVTDEHADLVPSDCVGLNLRGVVRRARITSIEDDPGVRKLTMRVDRQSAYTSNVTGIPLPPPTPPRPSIIAPSIGLTLDIPALTDDADDLHYLRAITGLTDVWAGAVDQRSMDGGASFASINTATQAAVVGVLQGDVTAASPHFTDTTNVVAVDLFVDRDIESISDQQFLSEGGAFALSYMDGSERKWELCQYRDADEDSGGNKLLSTLHRGLLNTEAAAHAPGDYFVLLGRGILKNNAQSAWLGQEMVHRAVSNGLTPETAATETTTYTGQSQMEFPVASVDLSLVGDALTVSIVPRQRFGTDDAPIRSINWTGYRVLATDGANSESYDTTSDTSVIDVTGWTGTITVTVSQINRITGAGPTVTESIPA